MNDLDNITGQIINIVLLTKYIQKQGETSVLLMPRLPPRLRVLLEKTHKLKVPVTVPA